MSSLNGELLKLAAAKIASNNINNGVSPNQESNNHGGWIKDLSKSLALRVLTGILVSIPVTIALHAISSRSGNARIARFPH